MMTKSDSEETSTWLKEYTYSPTFDQKKIRLTHTLLGHIVVASTVEGAALILKDQAEAWEKVGEPEGEASVQRTPHEILPIVKGQKMMAMQTVFSHILWAWSGVRKPGRAPWGEMAKVLQGRK